MRSKPELDKNRYFQFRVRGHLDHHWKEWLDGLDISYEKHGITVLTGTVKDQPQLHGLLLKIRDMGLSLISVRKIVNEQDEHNQMISHDQMGINFHQREIVLGKQDRLYSRILQEDRSILISLPQKYFNAKESYPILYHLDGSEYLFQLASVTIRYLSEWEKVIPPMIMVAIPNTNRDRDIFPTQAALPTGETIGGGADKFIKFIETELASYIDESYRTLPERVLYGTSNSGLTALYALLNGSRLFDAFIASSATLSWDGNFIFSKAQKAFKSWQPTPKYLYLICGKEDMDNIRQDHEDFANLLSTQSPENLTWGFDVSDETRHCPFRSLHDGLTMLYSVWDFSKTGGD